jgi:RNA polymerase sigma-70 factor (ECF subfamily)
MDEAQELKLARGLREGKIDAWQTFYDAFAERVWCSVARCLGPQTADVADVVQEAMMAAARSAASYDPAKGSLWFWLLGIARRHVALHFRTEERQQRLRQAGAWLAASNGRFERWLGGHEESPTAGLEAAELAELVQAALGEIPDDYGLLLTARYLDGVSVEQIAEHERSTPSAVRSKLARARAAFRDVFTRQAHPQRWVG